MLQARYGSRAGFICRTLGACVVASLMVMRAASAAVVPVDSLIARSARALSTFDPAARWHALEALEEATLRSPTRADVWLARGHGNLETGRFSVARMCLRRAAHLAPGDAAVWRSLGLAWKLDWLCSVEPASLDRAAECYQRACELEPGRAEDWTLLAALLVMRGHPLQAVAAGLRGRSADSTAAGPLLMLGTAMFRSGDVGLSERAFSAAMPLLPDELRGCFDGARVLEPWTSPPRDSSKSDRTTSDEKMWALADPDLTTAENEAQLDFRSRVSTAIYLFSERGEVFWDMRAELFARYGPPSSISYNSAGAQIGWGVDLEFRFPRAYANRYVPESHAYPFNMQQWHYDALGMSVPIWDRSLTHHYELPYSGTRDLDPRPDPTLLAGRPELVALGAGRGVFRALPPGSAPLPLTASVIRFPQGDSTRVIAHVFAPGTPIDTLEGTWALVDGSGRIVGRGSQLLAPAACEPAEQRVAEFSALVPPGDYRLHLSVSGSRHRRGLTRMTTHVDSLDAGLAMSDLVFMCTPPLIATGPGGVHAEPDLARQVSGTRDATVYYELDRLVTDRSGWARFAYTYSVHRAATENSGKDHRARLFEVTREEATLGTHRRQFVSVPVRELKPGVYELRLVVRDLANDLTVERRLRFTRARSRPD